MKLALIRTRTHVLSLLNEGLLPYQADHSTLGKLVHTTKVNDNDRSPCSGPSRSIPHRVRQCLVFLHCLSPFAAIHK
jgi:hypothetical protein